MDQVTATALIVALVINFVVLALAFGWAIRNRRRMDARRPPAQAAPRTDARPWWSEQAERAEAGDLATAPLAASSAEDPRPHSRAAEVFDALEPSTSWRSMLSIEAARISRYRRPATVVIADLEGLDRLAARLGPESVDRLLPAVAGTLRREARASDRVARLASARFGVLLPETDEVAAINWVERVREATDLWLEASAVTLRLAFGWAELGPDADVDAVLTLAYERLDGERRGQRSNPRPDPHSDGAGPRPDRPTGGRRRAETTGAGTSSAAGATTPPTAPTIERSGSPLAAG